MQKPITGDGQVLIVAAGDQTRVVATGRMISPIALSPDGHLLAYATVGFGGDDFTVLDVTTGELLHDGPAQTSGGRPAETFNLDWSADSRRLFQLTAAMSDPEGPVEGRLWDTAAGTLSLAGSVDGLPGAFIGQP